MQYVAFLRGMNVGGRRITNDDLCECFRGLGLQNVWAFLASGNVVLESPAATGPKLSRLIEEGLENALGYGVATFLRQAKDLARISATTPFAGARGAGGGKLQVAMLATKPSAGQREKALAFATEHDQLAVVGQELYWLPDGKLTDSSLDMPGIGKALGAMTVRTQRTIQRLSSKLAGR